MRIMCGSSDGFSSDLLRAKYEALDGSERRGWMLGPVLGADYPKLHSLVSQVPAGQRESLLAALRALSPEARDDLAVLAQRTPPQARDALRTRSEEHTSELQPLMRISYAVFRLKKKKIIRLHTTH